MTGTEEYPKFPLMNAMWGHQREEQIEAQNGLGWETADAQHIVAALDRLTEQQRIANLIAYASHRIEHTNATGPWDIAPALRQQVAEIDFSIREGLDL